MREGAETQLQRRGKRETAERIEEKGGDEAQDRKAEAERRRGKWSVTATQDLQQQAAGRYRKRVQLV